MTRDILTLQNLDACTIETILDLSERADLGQPLAGQGVALVFEKPSARTRSSMEMATRQLGGHPITIQSEEVGIGRRESAEDVARTLECYHALIAARVTDHQVVERMASAAKAPVINMLSDSDHPLQAFADLLTVRQLMGRIEGVKLAWVGDSNNVCRSLAQGCAKLGAELYVASPEGYQFSAAEAVELGIRQTAIPGDAVNGADIIYTDVWVSMGQAAETETRQQDFDGYTVDSSLMKQASNAWFFHCLPARRGEEVTAEVLDGPKSAVWRQAENRMHTARGAMAWSMGRK